MDFGRFLKLLLRRKWLLLGIPLLTVILAFVATRNLPNVYSSRAQLATGLADQTQVPVSGLEAALGYQEQRIDQEFNNLIQTMRTRRILDQVSYKLILHDISDTGAPFREPSELLRSLNPSAMEHAIQVYSQKYNNREPLYLNDPDQAGLRKVLKSMKYDDESILDNIRIYRLEKSDFIQIDYDSENPYLSSTVINTLMEEFILYYTSVVKENQMKAVTFLDSVLQRKQNDLNKQVSDLRTYKINNRVLNLAEQAKQLYEQLKDIEAKRQQNEQIIVANNGAIRALGNKFTPAQRDYAEGAMVAVNEKIIETKNQLRVLNEAYIRSGFQESYLSQIAALEQILTAQIQQAGDQYFTNPMTAKDNLVNQKIQLEISRDVAENGVRSLRAEQERINRKFDQLVPHEASIQSFENNIDIASEEYIEVLKKFNQTSLDAKLSVKLRQIERAQPGTLQPSKKLLLVALAGIASFIICFVALFVVFYLDNSIQSAQQLANETGLPVLGAVNRVPGTKLNLESVWNNKSTNPSSQLLKDQIRALRFEISEDLGPGSKVLAISSFTEAAGKNFMALNLAYAFSAINARVLIIDGDAHKYAAAARTPEASVVSLATALRSKQPLIPLYPYTTLSGAAGDESILEMVTEGDLNAWLAIQKAHFDLIIIKVPPLLQLNKAKEWLHFADLSVFVFEANKSLTSFQKQQFAYLKSLGSGFAGFIINKMGDPYRKKRRYPGLLSFAKKPVI